VQGASAPCGNGFVKGIDVNRARSYVRPHPTATGADVTDLHYLSATEVLRAFRERELSPVEILDAVSARADAVEPTVNCLLERDVEASRAEALAAQERYAAGTPAGPLDGLPVVLKEEQPIAGRSLRLGSLVTEGYVSEETHPVAERVLAAGGVVHARTTTPEFSCAAYTHSRLWGITRNPWNPDWTPGGSSGGSGAALASGTAYLASGSDIGGSIRIPASFCGVVGFKAPYGRVPAIPPWNLDTYCHDGAMGRTVADTALLHNTIQGQHPFDHVSLPALPIPADLGDVAGMRIALAVTLGDLPVEPGVEANTRAFADALKAAGAIVEEVSVPLRRADLIEAALVHYGSIMGPSMTDLGVDPSMFEAYTQHFLRIATAAAERTSVFQGLTGESAVHVALAQVLVDHDALICPTVGGYGFRAGEEYADGIDVAGTHLDVYLLACQTPIFNIASRHPVLSVPSGLGPNGVPTGVQVVARPYDDVTAFHVGAAAERELGLWNDPSWRPAL
jgi:aspartyl-tRNA(Asn)/glutamyl-tRNA(Gln) amidotransferase subunit A